MVGLVFLEATYDDQRRRMTSYFSYLGLVVVIISAVLNLSVEPVSVFFNAVVIDPFSSLMKILIWNIGAIYLNNNTSDINNNTKNEFNILAVGVLIGGMILSSANNMLTLYIGVETLSILSYVMASLRRNDETSRSWSKYSLFGGISAGLMLFGLSHIYGVLAIQFYGVVEKLGALTTNESLILIPSFLLFFAGIGYKIACVPFHMWSPDVYEGSPLPVTTFFSIVPKLAGITAVLRIAFLFLSNDGIVAQSIIGVLVVISAFTMTVGNITAQGKKDACLLSISHAGFMLMGVVVMGADGVASIGYYAIVYVFATLVSFYVLGFVSDTTVMMILIGLMVL